MPLDSLQNESLGFGVPMLLESIELQVEPGERVFIVSEERHRQVLDSEPHNGRVYGLPTVRADRGACHGRAVRHDGYCIRCLAGRCGDWGSQLFRYHEVSARIAHDHKLCGRPELRLRVPRGQCADLRFSWGGAVLHL